MSKIRVLIVDEAVVVRRMLANVLSSDPALEVVGTAPTGRIALAKITQATPDVVVLNVALPEVEGPELVTAIRKIHPELPVILFSKPMARNLETADSAPGPETASGMASLILRLSEQLLPQIKQCTAKTGAIKSTPVPAAPASPTGRSRSNSGFLGRQRIDIVAIGASTGGPNALTALLLDFPADCPVPIAIVQHMPPLFTGFLAERLSAKTAIKIGEGAAGEALRAGQAWIAPGNYHMELTRDLQVVRIRLHQGPSENSCRPAVDVLFRSVAETYGPGALAVVLSGMGQDGLRGCERIRAAGGQILVQDEATSIVWGMPGFVARAGLADQVLPLDQLGPEIIRRVRKGRSLSIHH